MMKKLACFLTGLLCLSLSYGQSIAMLTDHASRIWMKQAEVNRMLPPTDSIGYTGSASFCQGSSLVLTANYAPSGATYQWQISSDAGATFSDINGATSQVFTATASGIYTVLVTSGGTTTTYPPLTITVHQYPLANFTFSPNNLCSNIPISFTNLSTGTGLTYTWNFGDTNSTSNTSSATHPTHTFVGTPGNGTQSFTVSLLADNSGCSNTTTATITTSQVPGTQLGGTGFTTYNGLPYFTQCASITSNFSFFNQSTTQATNTSYTIKWGDNTPDFTGTSFTSTTHTYPIGNYPLQFIVTGLNGCKDTGRYFVFVGNNPAVGLNNPGNTFICSGTSLTFPISGTASNPPGTVYTVFFNDGSSPTVYNHPPPADVTHLFTLGSCGTISGGFPNSFQAMVRASNPCGTSAASVVPIYVSQKGGAVIGVFPKDTVCTSNVVSISNASANSFGVSAFGTCSAGKGVWKISPATGWTISSGSLGNDFGQADPTTWLSGSSVINVVFNTPGVYSIKLKTGASTICATDSIIKNICVNPVPVAGFTLGSSQVCAPATVTTTNTSNTPNCGSNSYTWSVSYANTSGCTPNSSGFSYVNGTSSTSVNPEFSFTNPGVYTITLVTKSPLGTCTSSPFSQTVTVKVKPAATIMAPGAVCQNGSINPTATVLNCYGTTPVSYDWSFPGGLPASSSSSSPGAIVYNTSGTYTISLTVTNECGSVTVNKQVTVNPAPNVVVPQDTVFCAGSATGAFAFTSSINGTTYTWTNTNTSIGLAAGGTGNINSFTTANPGSTPITATISVTPFSGCPGPQQSFVLTVNPRPLPPVVTSPVNYCINEAAVPLTGTPTAGNSITWYNNAALTGGTATAPLPLTSTPGSNTWYVTQTNSFTCSSLPATILVTVRPAITGNTVGTDQTICTNTMPSPLVPTATISGGSNFFSYQWQQSTDGGSNWTNITGAVSASYAPGALAASIKYRRVVVSSACSDTSNIVSMTVQGTLDNIGIDSAQTICSGTAPALLFGQTPSGGNGSFVYQWESSPNNSSWTLVAGETNSSYQPGILSASTYYRRKTSSGSCAAYAPSILITVNPVPVMSSVQNVVSCNNSTAGSLAFNSTPSANVSYTWLNDNPAIGLPASGSGPLPSFTTLNTGKSPVFGTITVTPTYTVNGRGCAGNAQTFRITVLPLIGISPVPDLAVCTGTVVPSLTPVHDADAFAGSSVSYSWTVSGSGTTLSGGSGNVIPSFNTINNGATDLITTITITPKYFYGNQTCNGSLDTYTVTVKPGTPSASAGPDTVLCAATAYNLQAVLPSNTTGIWTQVNGPAASIVNASAAAATVNNLNPGNTYQFLWTITGFSSCPASSDTVNLRVDQQVTNTIDTSTRTVCATQPVSITGTTPTGGNGIYQFQWQQSIDGTNWTDMSGQTGAALNFTPVQSGFVRRMVRSLPCFMESQPVHVIVQPALTGNTASADQAICINTQAGSINGSLPAGGNGVYAYQWQQSTDGGTSWNDIPGANAQSFNPGVLTATTKFRRRVSTVLCFGAQASTSNIVTVTVHPDAKALFQPADTVGCAPWQLTPASINLQTFPAQNGQYAWYVDNAFIGNGAVFPGYTMAQENDTITIKLVAISSFGCLSDSVSYTFYTFKLPHPAFTLSDTVGCGPLTVQLNNTTPDLSLYNYQWNFGNGQSSMNANPGTMVFLPNPDSGDTTYTVSLSVVSPCDTMVVTKTVRVKAKPKTLFAPDASVGCSPMTVSFNNNSRGLGNIYTWNFGDGSAPVSISTTGITSHTFITGIADTFFVQLTGSNECGKDSLSYAIVVRPNSIHLDFAVNGNQQSGCAPHAVSFINNSSGASAFTWTFGNGNVVNTTRNIDTLTQTFASPGTYVVLLHASNGCSDTSSTETVVVYPTPRAAFRTPTNLVCLGDSIRFSNFSDSATSYLWEFGDGTNSALANPVHTYATPGTYRIRLTAFRLNAPGSICMDTVVQQVQVVSSMKGSFTVSDTLGYCAPFTVSFSNANLPSFTALWDFGDNTTGSGNMVGHTYLQAGIYPVKLTVTVPGGCTYVTTRNIQVLGPTGSWSHTTGYVCNNNTANFQVQANNADSLLFQFGDGQTLTTTSHVAYHSYTNPGIYLPRVVLKNNAGCLVPLTGMDSIRVDRIRAGFSAAQQNLCGSTTVNFTDTTHAYFGKARVSWSFGDNTSGTGSNVSHTYTTTGNYTVKMIVLGNSGCSDTMVKAVNVVVNAKPKADIVGDTVVCARYALAYTASIQSTDAVNVTQWNLSNGATGTGPGVGYAFIQPGNYSLRLIVGTVPGCYDTVMKNIKVNPTPVVSASSDLNLCRGTSIQLHASSGTPVQYDWIPLQGLSCNSCPDPMAAPLITTPYVVKATNNFGCAATDTTVVTVIQPLRLTVSASDSICIGSSTNLLASGGSSYAWSPGIGLNNTTLSNPTASPSVTTNYRVVGYDGFNCFTDTAFVLVAVGQYPVVRLAPDQVLATGTLFPLSTTILNGPITNWNWTPVTDLSCANCALPIAEIKKDISYRVTVTNNYGCTATDTIAIRVFCESAQVFIPNAFTPDGDGYNDVLMVRASGIAVVKTFRIFNRWGEVVFEKGGFPPNNPAYGWDGRIKGVLGGPDVFVYTAEVVCENGSTYTYKGNVSLLK